MPRIFLIGGSTAKNDYRAALESDGHTINRFDSLDTALTNLKDKADLLIVDKKIGQRPFFPGIPEVISEYTQDRYLGRRFAQGLYPVDKTGAAYIPSILPASGNWFILSGD